MNTTVRAEILDMLAAGKISAAEAMNLLERVEPVPTGVQVEGLKDTAQDESDAGAALEREIKIDAPDDPAALKRTVPMDETYVSSGNGDKPRWLKIRVRDRKTDRNKVTVTLPLGLVSSGLGLARRFGAETGDVDLDEMMALVKSGERGMLIEVDDDEDGEHVQIYLD